MLKLLDRSIRDFRKFFAKLLIFELMYMFVTSIVVIPVITFVFHKIVRVAGSGSLLNGEVYRIGVSYKGVTGLLLIGLVASFAFLIELFVLIVLVQQRYFGKEIAIADALLIALRKTPRLLGFGVFQLMMLLLLLIPFVDSPLSASFYALFNVPIFLNNHVLDASYTLTFAYVLLLAVALYTLLRWIFVPHFIVLEDLKLRQAVRGSLLLTQGRRWQLFGSLLLFNAAVLAATSAALTALSYIPSWLNMDVLALVTKHYSLTLSTMLAYLLALLLLPINMFALTRLYYRLGRAKGEAKDRLRFRPSRLGRIEIRIWKWWRGLRHKRIVYASVAAAYFALSMFIGWRASDSLVYAKWSVLVAAHRGDTSNAPENSLLSVVSAIDKGAQVAELDVQLTKDGVAVLNHDSDLRRAAGVQTRVAELTYAELSQLSIGRDEEGNPVRIPTLYEVLSLAEGEGRIELLLDLKPYGASEALAEEVVRLVKETAMEQKVRIQSFDGLALGRIRELAPEIRIGRILYFALGDLSKLDVDFYTIEQVMLTDRLVNRAHADGREVWVWTVNARRNMKEVLKFQIDGMITDYPEMAQSMFEVDL